MAVGWSSVGDIAGLSREEIKAGLRSEDTKYRKTSPSRAAGELVAFRDETHLGDVVLGYKKDGVVGLIGEVVGPYS